VPWYNKGFYLPERPVFTLDPLYHAGAYYVQEASSMFLAHLFETAMGHIPARRVLDLCAAPGGKSTLLATLLQPDDLLISNEVIRARASILEENVTRWGYSNNWVTCNDPRDIGRLEGYFDCIVVDAPCSGSGLFRKDKGALKEWSENNVEMCSARQKRILSDVWPSLKEGGVLIYATCSFSVAEDEHILQWLNENFGVANVPADIPAHWGVVTTERSGLNGYRFLPGNVAGEGFFIAAVRKNESTSAVKVPRIKKLLQYSRRDDAIAFLRDKHVHIVENKEYVSAINPNHINDLAILQPFVYLRKTGLPLGIPGTKEWIPDHALALSIDLENDISGVDVNREQALKYLKREDPGVENAGKGWKVIRYQGLPLGWVKCLGNRMNNNLPKHWKIRMEIPDSDAG
jgi:NOL1/NOP2/fmu family ribosome biogenesis protein